jgi:hypothetical protein
MSKLDDVAAALFECDPAFTGSGELAPKLTWANARVVDDIRERCLRQARAAIVALMEPNERMQDAYYDAGSRGFCDEPGEPPSAEEAIRAMLQAVLDEGAEGKQCAP